MRRVFERIYRKNSWYYGESVSGPGSTLIQTETIRAEIPALFERFRVCSVLDAGCGDLNWLKELKAPLDQYVGVDVVSELVEENRRKFAGPDRRFELLDVTKDPLPRADLVLCRDCLVHFSFADIFAALRNFRRSGSKYLLTTTFPARTANQDIRTGSWRTLNYQVEPFRFPAPLALVDERLTMVGDGAYADKSLGLWEIARLPL